MSQKLFKLSSTSSLTKCANPLLISSSATAVDDSNTLFEVNSNTFCKMLLKSTASNNSCELAFKSNNKQGNIKYSGSSETLEFNSFLIYDIKVVGNTRVKITDTFIQNSCALDMSRNPIRFRDQGDDNHKIVYESNDIIFGDGLRIQGYSGLVFSTQHYGNHFLCFNDSNNNAKCGGPFAYVITSDDRIKFNETPLTNCLETIKKLNPVSYRKTTKLGEPDNPNLPIEYGLVAQEVYNNVPELRHAVIFDKTLPRNFVNEDLNGDCVENIYKKATDSDGITTIEPHICYVSYQDINIVSIKALQELYKLVQTLQAEIKALKQVD